MDEQQVRQLVRQAIARHLGPAPALPSPSAASRAPEVASGGDVPLSFARFHLTRPAAETECLIEPTVTCNHCGHCQCFGH